MNKADSDRIQELCLLISVEKDRRKFLILVEELNQILAAKDDCLLNNDLDDKERG